VGVARHNTAPPVFLPRKTRWVVGCDLGTAADYTALSVLQSIEGALDFRSEYDRHCNIAGPPQKKRQELHVKHLERLPLGLSYPQIIEHVIERCSRPPLTAPKADLVVDDSGVGRAVSDLMIARGLHPVRFTITGGQEQKCIGQNRWHVSKEALITKLDALLNDGALKFAAALTESGALKSELVDFRRTVGAAGRATWAARTGAHDDLILTIACAAWWATRPPPVMAQTGHFELLR
jgi:hypothetical protein